MKWESECICSGCVRETSRCIWIPLPFAGCFENLIFFFASTISIPANYIVLNMHVGLVVPQLTTKQYTNVCLHLSCSVCLSLSDFFSGIFSFYLASNIRWILCSKVSNTLRTKTHICCVLVRSLAFAIETNYRYLSVQTHNAHSNNNCSRYFDAAAAV